MTEIYFLRCATFLDYLNYVILEDGSIFSKYIRDYLEPSINKDEYYVVSLCKDREAKNFSVHIIIATAFIPNPNNHPYVNHKDMNKLNNRVENLEWVTAAENNRHARANGAKCGRARKVFQFTKDGKFVKEYPRVKDAAAETGISTARIFAVLSGLTMFTDGFFWSKEKIFNPRYSGRCKPVNQICLETGEILATFMGGEQEAREVLGIRGKIGEVCKGNRKQASGYGWEYAKIKKDTKKEWDKWAVLPEYPSYKISRDGRIYSKIVKRLLILTPRAGYIKIVIKNKDGSYVHVSVHILVARAYIPNPHNYPIVNHIDENGLNNNVENLEWTTHSGNSQHSIQKNIDAHKRKGHKFTSLKKTN